MTKIFNKASQKSQRRSLRRNSTPAERRLWSRLRAKKLHGHKFRRQASVGQYILDFYCAELKLAIEVDGDSHYLDERQGRELKRKQFLESLGLCVLRFTNTEVHENLEGVLDAILRQLQSTTPPPPAPPC